MEFLRGWLSLLGREVVKYCILIATHSFFLWWLVVLPIRSGSDYRVGIRLSAWTLNNDCIFLSAAVSEKSSAVEAANSNTDNDYEDSYDLEISHHGEWVEPEELVTHLRHLMSLPESQPQTWCDHPQHHHHLIHRNHLINISKASSPDFWFKWPAFKLLGTVLI